MTGNRLNAMLAGMSSAEYQLLVGTQEGDPLCRAFTEKRGMHGGFTGSEIKPAQWQAAWNGLMAEEAQPGKRVAYIHIPFCQRRCLYCGFFQNYSDAELERAYIECLVRELQMAADTRYLSGAKLNAVFIGGGTPSSLSSLNAAKLLKALRAYLPLTNDYELTLEARINDLIPEKMEVWLAHGVNRVSIGVQSFNTRVRRAVGRIDATEAILNKLQLLSAYGQAAVIVDLMYGLPYQTMAVWLKDLQFLTRAAIDGWDLYQLNVYETSALKAAITAGRLPAAATVAGQAKMFAAAEAILADHCFPRISVCHWSKSNRERNMYNTLTKSSLAVLPFGAGGGGRIGGVSLSLERKVERYMNMIRQGDKPIAAMRQPHSGYSLQKAVMGQIKQGYIDLGSLAGCHGSGIWELEPLLKIWERRGLLQTGARVAKLTVAGQFWYMNIARSILECLNALYIHKAATKVE